MIFHWLKVLREELTAVGRSARLEEYLGGRLLRDQALEVAAGEPMAGHCSTSSLRRTRNSSGTKGDIPSGPEVGPVVEWLTNRLVPGGSRIIRIRAA